MNKEEFTRQVLAAEKSLYRVAKSILGNDEDCADAMQNAILKAYEKLDTLRNVQHFKTWITRILMNECYQILRKNHKYVTLEEMTTVADLEGGHTDSWQYEAMAMQELMRLDEKFRIPFVLHEVEGYSLKEIAKMLGLTETNVKSRIFRARKTLRMRLEGEV